MNNLFGFLILGTLIALPVGLVHPSWFVTKLGLKRGKFALIDLALILILFIGFGITMPSKSAVQGTSESLSIQTNSPTTNPTSGIEVSTIQATPEVTPTPTLVPTSTLSPQPTPTSKTASQTTTPNTYKNSAGNTVQSPTYYDSAPAGASAQCRDGTYSFSQSRSGTCSHHGGVAQWL